MTRVTRLIQPEPGRPPYSMNQRNAWIGASSEGVPSWSEETTGSGPVVVAGVPAISPDSSVPLMIVNFSADAPAAGTVAPKTGLCATTPLGLGSHAKPTTP